MLELFLLPVAIGAAAAMFPGPKNNDRKKIETLYKKIGFALPPSSKDGKPEYPRFKKKMTIMNGEEQIGMRYLYTVPLGLAPSILVKAEENLHYFRDGMNHPVVVEFRRITEDKKDPAYDPKKYMMVSVFENDIPTMFPYSDCPAVKDEWKIPLGKTLEGIVWLNFDHIPHMTIAGVTRFGKTVFLKVLMTYLISNHPDDAEFYIIDLKGGLEFSQYAELPQVKGRVAGDYMEAFMMALGLHNLLNQDLKFFKAHGIRNIVNSKIKKRRFIIVDEAAQLAAEKFMTQKVKDIPEIQPYMDLLPKNVQTGTQKDMMNYTQYLLSEIARLGGALGYRLIYCTQYPTADTLPRQIKMNSDAKLTYRLPTGYASEVAIDTRGAEELPSGIKGRALYKTHDLTEMQTPLLEDKDMWKILSRFRVPRLKGEKGNGNGKNKTNRKARRNFEFTGPPAVCNTGTASNNPSIRDE